MQDDNASARKQHEESIATAARKQAAHEQEVLAEIDSVRSANEQLERAVTQLTQERVQYREQQASWYAERERLEAFGVQEERKHADTCAALAGARKELDVRQRGFDEQRAELSAAVAVAEDSRKKLDLSFAQAEMLSGEIQVSLCKREALVAGLC
jgi:predicted  nucleic acid-binding Zn-ribbon protein